LKVLKQYISFIEYIKKPAEKALLEVVKQNGNLIKYIDDPTEKVIIEAVRQNKHAIQYVNIESLSEETKEVLVYLL